MEIIKRCIETNIKQLKLLDLTKNYEKSLNAVLKSKKETRKGYKRYYDAILNKDKNIYIEYKRSQSSFPLDMAIYSEMLLANSNENVNIKYLERAKLETITMFLSTRKFSDGSIRIKSIYLIDSSEIIDMLQLNANNAQYLIKSCDAVKRNKNRSRPPVTEYIHPNKICCKCKHKISINETETETINEKLDINVSKTTKTVNSILKSHPKSHPKHIAYFKEILNKTKNIRNYDGAFKFSDLEKECNPYRNKKTEKTPKASFSSFITKTLCKKHKFLIKIKRGTYKVNSNIKHNF